MMPQKKNPGALELLRGRSGRVNGLLVAGLTMMKGLPSGYNRDFHEDKEIMVEAFDIACRAAHIISPVVTSTKINLPRLAELPHFSFSTATELANYLVSKHQVPFRQAHHVVGSLVGELSRSGSDLRNTEYALQHLNKNGIKADPKELAAVLDPHTVMSTYNSEGGTGPKAVANMLTTFNQQLETHKKQLHRDNERVQTAYQAALNIAKNSKQINSADDIQTLINTYGPK